MDEMHRLEAKGLARAKIRSKRRRVQVIRRRAVRSSLALFAISWGIIFGQLVTGNDPALSRSHATRKLLASTRRTKPTETSPADQSQMSDDEGTAVSVSPPPVSESVPAPVTVAPPPPPAPIVTSAS